MLSSTLATWGVTRDDLKIVITKWAAVITAMAPLGLDVTKFGIPARWVPYIQGLAFIIAVVSGTLQTSQLPGSNAPAIKP